MYGGVYMVTFTKMHGLGNDFVLINGFCEEIPSDLVKLSYQM